MDGDLSKLLQTLKNDPKIADALKRGDLSALVNNPKVQQTVNNLESTPPPEALTQSLLSTPQAQQLKKMLDSRKK